VASGCSETFQYDSLAKKFSEAICKSNVLFRIAANPVTVTVTSGLNQNVRLIYMARQEVRIGLCIAQIRNFLSALRHQCVMRAAL
jgi:hypothetical protein